VNAPERRQPVERGDAVAAQRRQQRPDPRRRRQQRADRVDHQREAELGHPLQRQRRGAPALGPVEHQRRHALQLGRHPLDVGLRRRRLDEQQVGAGRGVGAGPVDRIVDAGDGDRVGARDEHQVRVAPRRHGGAQLAHHLVGPDQRLAAHVPALLGHHLVLELVRYTTGLADGGLFVRKVPALAAFAEDAPGEWGELTLAPTPGEPVVAKQYASAFFGTTLAPTLQGLGVDTVVVAGVSTSGCVRATAMDALNSGFRPQVVRQACADRSPTLHENNLADLDAQHADVVDLPEALGHL